MSTFLYLRKQGTIILTLTFHFSHRSVIRLSLRELDKTCNAQKKNDFLKAWKLIQELPSTNPNSFWSIASYHGMPFKKRRPSLGGGKSEEDVSGTDKDEDSKTWGGYCQHGNVLFPFWHRLYCLRLEQALQSVLEKGQERVALHYWDASSKESKSEGLPDIVTTKYVYIDGKYVPNPLLNFKLPKAIKDEVSPSRNINFYEKEADYETCRYPYSGIRSPDAAKEAAIKHNKTIDDRDETAQSLLQANIISWLTEGARHRESVAKQLEDCLDITDYNPFSNTSSAGEVDYSLEQPHNDLHVAIGGFTKLKINADGSVEQDSSDNFIWDGAIEGANGDMGANEVASYDPVFFLHHSNIDRMLWIWQKKYKKTYPDTFTIDNSDDTDKGISNSNQGATPNQTWGQKLNENTILYPFQDEYGVPRTSKDCIDIVSQLGYDYSIGSLDQATWPEPVEVNTVRLMVKPSTPWRRITDLMTGEIERISALEAGTTGTGTPARSKRLRMIFDRTHLIPSAVSEMQMQAAAAFRHIPICPTDPIADPFVIKGLHFKFKNFVQVKGINKDKISGSFLVLVLYKAAEKLYYLGQRSVLSRWNRSNCANCQGRRMAHVSIPIRVGDTAPYDPQNLKVYFIYKDGMTGEYRYKTPTDLLEPAASPSAPGKQEPSLSIIGAFIQE